MPNRAALSASLCLSTLLAAPAAFGAFADGELLGVFDGYVNADTIYSELGLQVEGLARIVAPDTANDGLVIFDIISDDDDDDDDGDDGAYDRDDDDDDDDDNEYLRGKWMYEGFGTVALIVVSDGEDSAVYFFDDGLNMGLWDTGALDDDDGLKSITAFRVVPVPGAVWLFGSALLGLAAARRRRG